MALRFVYQISCNLNKTVTAKTIQHANHYRSMSPCFQHVQGFKKVAPNHCRSQPLLSQSCQKSANPATQTQMPNATAHFSNYRDNKYDEEYEHKPQKVYISNPYSKPRRAKRFPLKERLNRIASYYKQQMKYTTEDNELSAAVEECPKVENLREEEISIPPTLSRLNLHSRYKRKKYYLEDSVPREAKKNNDTDVYEKLAKRVIKRDKKVIPHLQPNNMKPYGSSKTMYSPRAHYTKRSSSKISFKANRKQRFKKFEPTTAPYNFDNEKFIKRKKSLPKMSWNREYSTSSKPDEVTVKTEGFLKRTASFIKNFIQKKSPSVTEVKEEVVADEKIEKEEPSKSADWERCERIICMYKELNPTQQLVKKSYPSGSAEEKQAVQEAMDFVAKCSRSYQLERFGNSKSKESIISENKLEEKSKTEQPSVAKSSIKLDTPSFIITKRNPPISSYSDVLKHTKPKSKSLVIYPNNNNNKNLYSTFYARNFSTSSQNSKVSMKIPHRVRGFKTSSKCLKVQVSNRNRNYSKFTKNFFPKSETNMQSRFKSSKKNNKHPFCGVTPFDPPPNNVDPCLPQDCVYVKKPKPLDWKLKRLRKRCQPMEPERKCPPKKNPCSDRADACLKIEKKKLPTICPADDCPCNHELMKEGCPLPRLKSDKVQEPPRKIKCRPVDPCPPRADAKLKPIRKRLPRLMVHKIGKTVVNYPEVKLKRLCKEKVKERKRVCPVPKTCESQPRADDGMEIEMLTLRPLPCECKKIQPEPLKDVRMRRLKKITIEPPPRVCPPVNECEEMVTKSDVACGYTVKEKTLQPMVLKSAYNYINIHYYANKKKSDGEKKYHTLASSSTNDRLPKGKPYSTAAFLNSSNFQEAPVKKREKRLKKKLLSNLMISLANYNIARRFPKPKNKPSKIPIGGNASWNYLAKCLSNRENIKPDHTLSTGMCQKLLGDFPLTPKSSVRSENLARVRKSDVTKRTRVLGYSKLCRRELSTSPITLKKKCDSASAKKCVAQKLENCDKRARQTCQNVYKFKKYVKQEPPYPSYSECGLTFEFPKCECPASQKHLQPQYELVPKIKLLKPPPPESDIIDVRKVKKCVLKKLDKVNEGETKNCENFNDPYQEFDGLHQLNSKLAAELKQDRNRRIPQSGKAGTKCGCPVAVLSVCEQKKSGNKAPRATDGCGKDSSKGFAPRAKGSCNSNKSKAPRAKIDCNKDKPKKPKCGKDK